MEKAHSPICVWSLNRSLAPSDASTVNAMRVESPDFAAIEPDTSSTTRVRSGNASTAQSRSVVSIDSGFLISNAATEPTPLPSAKGVPLDVRKPAATSVSVADCEASTDANAAPAALTRSYSGPAGAVTARG